MTFTPEADNNGQQGINSAQEDNRRLLTPEGAIGLTFEEIYRLLGEQELSRFSDDEVNNVLQAWKRLFSSHQRYLYAEYMSILDELEPRTALARVYKAYLIRREQNRNSWSDLEVHNNEIGYFKDNETFIAKTNFQFIIVRELQSEGEGGLLLRVTRSVDGSSHQVFIQSKDYTTSKQFEDALKERLGLGIVSNLTNAEVKALIHDHLFAYHFYEGVTFRLVDRVGQQEDGAWVFRDKQFTRNGQPTTERESRWVYNDSLGKEDYMPSPEILPEDPYAIRKLVLAQKRFFGATAYLPAVLVLGYVAASVHYKTIIEAERCFPILNLFGDPGSNKTIAVENALGLVGWSRHGMMSKVTESALYERLKLSGSIPNCLDDPTKDVQLDELLRSLYNAKPRVVRGNYQEPHGSLIVTSNFACGDNSPATLSRLIQIHCSVVKDGEKQAWGELQEAQNKASSGFASLIRLGYRVQEVNAIEQELIGHLTYAHARIARSLALITHYSMKVMELASENPEDIKQYVLDHLCPSANDTESINGSLTAFITGLDDLHLEGKIGPWNCRVTTDRSNASKSLALRPSSIWKLYERDYQPKFSRKVIEAEIKARGGNLKGKARFEQSQDQRPLPASSGGRTNKGPRTCWLIPFNVVCEALDISPDSDVVPFATSEPTDTSQPRPARGGIRINMRESVDWSKIQRVDQ